MLFAIGIRCIAVANGVMAAPDTGEPFFDLCLGWLQKVQMVSVAAGFLLLAAEAYIWNRFINSQTLLNQTSNLPALFYILLLSLRPIQIGFYPALVASFFLILAITRLSESSFKEKALSESFDAGFFTGMATLFYFPSSVFLIFLWVSLLLLRSVVWREMVVSLIGFTIPALLTLACYNILFRGDNLYIPYRMFRTIWEYRFPLHYSWKHTLLTAVLGITGLVTIIFFVRGIANNVVKKRKIWSLMLWFSTFGLAAGIIAPHKDAGAFSSLAIPCSFIFSNYFLKSKSRWLPDLLFILLALSAGINIALG